MPTRPTVAGADPERTKFLSNARRRRYNRAHERFRRALMASGNIVCQHIDPRTHERCTSPAEILHHLLSADDYPELMNDYRNAVMLCRAHHPNTPGDPGGIEYAPTRWPMGGTVEGTEPWTLETQRPKLLRDCGKIKQEGDDGKRHAQGSEEAG